jgi:two-component system, LytTR family, sensor kinase
LTTRSLPYRKLILSYVSWCLIWIALHTIVLYESAGFDFEPAIKDAALTHGMLALATYALFNILRFYQPRQIYRFLYSIGFALAAAYLIRFLSPYVVSPDVEYAQFVEKSFLLRCIIGWVLISLISASIWLWTYVNDLSHVEERKNVNEKLAREAELSRLRQQLQPHFLFNSLNSISALVVIKPEEARKMIQQLSDFLRGTLKRDEQQLVLLSEELDHLQLYLDIEKVRFGHRLKTNIISDEKSLSLKLPSLLLQPIVENAIKFGLYDTTGEIVIRIIAKADDQYLSITVENPYDPETATPRQGTGFGLNSVQRRLYLLYARHDLLATEKDEVTFRTSIKIPQLA